MIEAVKFLILAAALTTATFSRKWCLAIVVFLMPLSLWLPQYSVSGLNATNMLLLPLLLHAFLTEKDPDYRGRDPLLIPMIFLVLFLLISLVRVQLADNLPGQFSKSNDQYVNLITVKAIVVGFAVYFCSRRLTTNPEILRLAVLGAVAGYLLQAVMAVVDFVRGVEGVDRASGMLGDSNEFGLFLAANSMIPVAFVMARVRGLLLPAMVAATISVLGILGTLSRGALLAWGIGATTMAGVRRNFSTLVILALIGTSPLWLPQNILDRFSEPLARDRWGLSSVPGFSSNPALDLDREARYHLWQAGIRMIVDKPIFGVGLGRFKYHLPEYGYQTQKQRGPHNVYLWLGAQAGLPALLAHLALMLIVGKMAFRLAVRRDGTFESAFGLGMMGMVWAFLAGGVFVSGFYANIVTTFFVLAGITTNLYCASRRDLKAPRDPGPQPSAAASAKHSNP